MRRYLLIALLFALPLAAANKSRHLDSFMGIPLSASQVEAKALWDTLVGAKLTKDTTVSDGGALVYSGGTLGGYQVDDRRIIFRKGKIMSIRVFVKVTSDDALSVFEDLGQTLQMKYGPPDVDNGKKLIALERKAGQSDAEIYGSLSGDDLFFFKKWGFKLDKNEWAINCEVGYNDGLVEVSLRNLTALQDWEREQRQKKGADF